MDQKMAVTGKLAAKYRGCKGRKQRTRILAKLQELTGYNRHYTAWLLRNFGKTRLVQHPGGRMVRLVVGRRNLRRKAARPRKYDKAVKKILWASENLSTRCVASAWRRSCPRSSRRWLIANIST